MRRDNFSSEQKTELARDFRISVAKCFEFAIAQGTDFTVLEGRDGAGVIFGWDRFGAEYLSAHVEIGDLFAAVFGETELLNEPSRVTKSASRGSPALNSTSPFGTLLWETI